MHHGPASAATRSKTLNGHLRRLLLAAIVGCAAPVLAQDVERLELDASHFYVGAGLGAVHYGNACDATALSCDHTAQAAGIFGGYRFNQRVALELEYRDLGEARAQYPRLTGPSETTGDVDGYGLAALVSFPLPRNWHAFLRGGAFDWQVETQNPHVESSETGWSAAGGGGFGWRFRPAWEARLEYVYFDGLGGAETGETDAQVLSVGVSRLFGKRAAAQR